MAKSTTKYVYKKKTLEDLFEEIHNNSINTRTQVYDLINQLSEVITSPGESTMIVPLIRSYLDVAVKNDEHLIKLAQLVQKEYAPETAKSAGDSLPSIDEIERILKDQEQDANKLKEGPSLENE